MTNVSSGPAPHLERVIRTGGLAASALNCIVGSGIFGLPGIAAAMLGPAAVLAYLICAVLVGLIGLCLAEVGSRVSHPGGLYAYATESFGPVVGGVAGTLLWFANSVISAAAVANLLMDTLALVIPALGSGVWRFMALVHAVRRPCGGEHPRVAIRRATVDAHGRREDCSARAARRRGRVCRTTVEPAVDRRACGLQDRSDDGAAVLCVHGGRGRAERQR